MLFFELKQALTQKIDSVMVCMYQIVRCIKTYMSNILYGEQNQRFDIIGQHCIFSLHKTHLISPVISFISNNQKCSSFMRQKQQSSSEVKLCEIKWTSCFTHFPSASYPIVLFRVEIEFSNFFFKSYIQQTATRQQNVVCKC